MDEVAEVKNRLEIVEVVGAYVPLKQAGRNLKAPCPFHQEKTASFMVSPEKGIYHCFGCNEGGDIFSFVMKMEGLDFRGALELLARKAGVELKERGGDGGAAKKLRDRLLAAHELAVKYYQATLVKNARALEYVVKKRGLTKETIREFRIGYAPDSWNALTDFLVGRGFEMRDLVQGGLAGQKEGRRTVYDLFRERIMFPICDREGRPIGFTGRVLDDSVPKYLNTPQSPLYDKSQAIYGLHLAKEAIRQADEVVLVEGQMDVVASHQAGMKQVVAASGTALTIEHLRTLSKLTKNIKLAFDSDRAGLAATERAIDMGQQLGLSLRMVVLPEGVKDADELTRRDVGAWRRAIGEAKYIVDYLFDRYAHDFDLNSAVGKRGYTDRLAGTLRRLGDPVERDHYVKRLAERVGASEEAVRAKVEGRQVEQTRRAVVQAEKKVDMRARREELFLALNVVAPLVRASLNEVTAERFSAAERAEVYRLLQGHRKAPASELAAQAGVGVVDYVNRLRLIGEEEFDGIDKNKLQQTAFEFARGVFVSSNRERRERLNAELRQVEERGDEARRDELLAELKAIIDSEA